MAAVNTESTPPQADATASGLTRRQRVHRATKAELVDAARAVLVDEGLPAVTVRAVAARLGMTAPALYRYYASRETLLEDVIDMLYDELAAELEQARESARGRSLTERFVATARRFRAWALEHRAEFGLLFGAPVPGVDRQGADLACAAESSRGERFMLVWLSLFREIGETGRHPQLPTRPIPPRLRAQLAAFVEQVGGAVPVEMALLFLISWQELYGFICTEAFGHLAFALDDASELFEERLAEFRERLDLP